MNKKKVGRPKKDEMEFLGERISIVVNKPEKERIEKIIRIKETSINQFFRDLLDENLKRIEKELDIII